MRDMRLERNLEKKVNIALCFLLAFAGTWCLPFMLNLKGNGLSVTNSYFGVFIWAVCGVLIYQCFTRTDKTDRRGLAAAGIFSFLFSLCIAFGVQLEAGENVDFKNAGMWASVILWTVILTLWVHRSWELLKSRAEKGENGKEGDTEKRRTDRRKETGILHNLYRSWDGLTGKRQAALTVCFFLICWLPVFLAVYPGFFVYDAQDEFIQVQTRNFTTHHPLPHVLLLGGIILAGNKLTGSYNVGIALYTLFQMLLMAGVFTYALRYMKDRGARRILRVVTAFYFGLFPVIVMFVLCSAKDGIFTAALLILLLFMADMAGDREAFFSSFKKKLGFLISAFVMMCFRHNGMYAFLVITPVLLLYMKGFRRQLALWLGGAFALYFFVTSGLAFVLSAESAENQEMLTVPIQQLARTYKYDKDSFSEEELEILYEILPEEALSYYTAKVSDGVKIWFDNGNFSSDPEKYIGLWAKTGAKHPFTYLNAWFMTSYGFWYPDTVIDVYRGNGVFTFTYEDSSFFGYEVEQPGSRESRIPWLNEWYRRMSLEIAQHKIPVVSMLFSPGFLFWIYAFACGYAFYRGKRQLLIPFLMVFFMWLTVILGPTYLPRYVLILWYALPFAVALLVNKD